MTDRKFTEGELVELLRAYVKRMCGKCNVKDLGNCCNSCFLLPISQSADLIERQKAESEEHRRVFETILKEIKAVKALYVEDIGKAKAEAIKEFAERMKADLGNPFLRAHGCVESIIDNLVKGMTEGTK